MSGRRVFSTYSDHYKPPKKQINRQRNVQVSEGSAPDYRTKVPLVTFLTETNPTPYDRAIKNRHTAVFLDHLIQQNPSPAHCKAALTTSSNSSTNFTTITTLASTTAQKQSRTRMPVLPAHAVAPFKTISRTYLSGNSRPINAPSYKLIYTGRTFAAAAMAEKEEMDTRRRLRQPKQPFHLTL